MSACISHPQMLFYNQCLNASAYEYSIHGKNSKIITQLNDITTLVLVKKLEMTTLMKMGE